jgi:hypothetical protein
MRHRVAHALEPALARRAAEHAFAVYAERYGRFQPEIRWSSPTRALASFHANGITVRGAIELEPGAIAFELDVPWLLRLFESRAMAVVEREVRHWTEAALRGEI